MTPLDRAARAIAEELAKQEPTSGGTYFIDTDNLGAAVIDGTFDLTAIASAVLVALRDAFDESGMVEAARQMAEVEGSEAATKASLIYDQVIDWFDAALPEKS